MISLIKQEAIRESLKKELGSLNAWTDVGYLYEIAMTNYIIHNQVVMYKNTNPLARDMFYKANNPEKVITITPEEVSHLILQGHICA